MTWDDEPLDPCECGTILTAGEAEAGLHLCNCCGGPICRCVLRVTDSVLRGVLQLGRREGHGSSDPDRDIEDMLAAEQWARDMIAYRKVMEA